MTPDEKRYRGSLIHDIWKDRMFLELVLTNHILRLGDFVNQPDHLTSIKLGVVFYKHLSEISDKWAGRRDEPLPESTEGLEEMHHELEVDLTQGSWMLEAFSEACETPAQTVKWMESLAEPLTLELVFNQIYPGNKEYEALMTPPPSWISRHVSKNNSITDGNGTDSAGADGRDGPGEIQDGQADVDDGWVEPSGTPDGPEESVSVGLIAAR
jgi:hypothetical protein